MTGLKIARKSFQLITSNFQDVFRICAVLYLFDYVSSALATYLTTGVWTLDPPDPNTNLNTLTDVTLFIATLAIPTVITIWVAVAWHRYVLLEESPQGWIPRWNKKASLAYFLNGLKLMLLFLLYLSLLIILTFLAAPLALLSSNPFFIFLVSLILVTLFLCVFLRICLAFPAAAIGKKMTMTDSWNATSPYSSSLFFLAGILGLFSHSLQTVSETIDMNVLLSSVVFLLNIVWGFWTLSIMTVLYGCIIEGRDIETL